MIYRDSLVLPHRVTARASRGHLRRPSYLEKRSKSCGGLAVFILIPANPPGAEGGKVMDRQGSRQMALSG